jgi:OOP family OmpA-OmpF porin
MFDQKLARPEGRKMKGSAKVAITVVLVAGALFGFKAAVDRGLVPGINIGKSTTVAKSELPDIKDSQVQGVEPVAYPNTEPANVAGPQVRFDIWAWNTQMGLIYANGGPATTTGSLMEKHNVNLKLVWQDDTNQMINDLMACAKELKSNEDCDSGSHFMAIMTDQTAAFFASNNPNFKKLCDDCTLELIGAAGRSDGEDALMGPPAWKEDAQNAKGGTVAAVIREGDWNIAIKWAADNQIPVNPDDTTYDPGAINFINPSTYTDASEKYNASYCEDRRVAINGKLTGEKKHVCIDAIATWTPADVTAAHGKGGLVRIVSTHQYRGQMPNAIIGIKKWDSKHSKIVASMLAAMFEGGDQVRAFPEALKIAGKLSDQVYGDQREKAGDKDPGGYWVKYYKGVREEDSQGNMVDLGGSKVFGLADNLSIYGLAPGSVNTVKASYNTFGNWVHTLYPKVLPEVPKFEEVVNTKYLLAAKNLVETSGEAESVKFTESTRSTGVVSRTTLYIQFDTGRATLKPEGKQQLRELADNLSIASGLLVIVHGYTDNTGNPQANVELSKARAEAVKQYLMDLAPSTFPATRFRVAGHGEEDPIAENTTESGRAKNRRVKIVLGNPNDQ